MVRTDRFFAFALGVCFGAYLHDTAAIRQILDYLGLSPPEQPKPPPAVHKVVRARAGR